MHPLVKDLTGQRFGLLTVIKRAGSSPQGIAKWRCRCDCGKTSVVYGTVLRNGNTRSCGHLWRDWQRSGRVNFVHGDNRPGHRTPEYRAWHNMIQRCENPNNKRYREYGGRGIAVCKVWRNDYRAFLAHVGRKPSARHTLDRIDNDGNYQPGNVRWATLSVQNRNRRPRGG